MHTAITGNSAGQSINVRAKKFYRHYNMCSQLTYTSKHYFMAAERTSTAKHAHLASLLRFDLRMFDIWLYELLIVDQHLICTRTGLHDPPNDQKYWNKSTKLRYISDLQTLAQNQVHLMHVSTLHHLQTLARKYSAPVPTPSVLALHNHPKLSLSYLHNLQWP